MTQLETLSTNDLELDLSSFKLGPLNMHVPMGAMYGFIGRNGAGKTTTLKLIMGMGMPDAGSIRVFGMDPLKEAVAVKGAFAGGVDITSIQSVALDAALLDSGTEGSFARVKTSRGQS